MKDYSYIIEKMNREERERAQKQWEPVPLQLPLVQEDPRYEQEKAEETSRGVVIIDFGNND